MTTDNGTDHRPFCPRCAATGWVDPECPICEMLRSGQLPMGVPMVVVRVEVAPRRSPGASLRRLFALCAPVFAGAIALSLGASGTARWLGGSEWVQFGMGIAGGVTGMLLAALMVDRNSARRRRRLPAPPPRASMPEQIPEPRSTT